MTQLDAAEARFDRIVATFARWPVDQLTRLASRLGASADPLERRLDLVIEQARTRSVLDSPWLHRNLVGILLPIWFVLLAAAPLLGWVGDPSTIFFDARLYVASTRAWLEGSNPWDVSYHGVYYAAPPPSLLPLAPFALLPPPLDWLAVGMLCVAATLWTIRHLGLAWWWLLFPPVVQGVLGGNVQMLLIPLIIKGGGWLAGILKIYALVPLAFLGRWRQIGAALLLIVVTIPILPWGTYLANIGLINQRLDEQTGYGLSFTQSLLLLPPALLAMAVVGRWKAAWLAVPALWPAQQWYYASLALPVRSALVGAIIAVPTPGSGALALFALALYELWHRRRAARLAMAAGAAAMPRPNTDGLVERTIVG